MTIDELIKQTMEENPTDEGLIDLLYYLEHGDPGASIPIRAGGERRIWTAVPLDAKG